MHHQQCGHEHGGHGDCEDHHEHGGHCQHHEHHGGHGHSNCEESQGESECKIEEFMCLAKTAWKKLMVEKIKTEMERMDGEKLNRLAKLIAETKFKKFKAKQAKHHAMEEFQEQLEQIMSSNSH